MCSPQEGTRQMKSLALLILLSASSVRATQIQIGIGEQRRITLPFRLEHYSVGSTAVRVHVSDRKSGNPALLVKGAHKGNADVWIQGPGGKEITHRFQVSNWPEFVASPLQQSLSDLTEMEIVSVGDGAVVHGTVTQSAEWKKLGALEKLASTSKIQIQAELSAELKSACISNLHQKLSAFGLSRLKIDERMNPPRLSGAVPEKQYDQLKFEFQKACPLVGLDLETLGEKSSTLFFRVFLLEVKKDQFHHFGLSAETVANGFQAKLTNLTTLFDLEKQFQFMSHDGSLRVLSKPELAVRAPGEAELFAGGEIPIRLIGRGTVDVRWKNYGLSLKIKVNQATSEKVRLEISTEVSHLDNATKNDDIPGVKTNRMKTQVDATLGRPLFLSGLLHEDQRKDIRGFPALKDIPILGALFSSQEYQSAQSELVAVLLPHAETPNAPMEKFGESRLPDGPLPPPRNWLSAEDMRNLKQSSDYPWNALE